MATTRLMRASKPISNVNSSYSSSAITAKSVRCTINKAGGGFGEEKGVSRNGEPKRSSAAMKASVATSDNWTITTEKDVGLRGIDMAAALANATNAVLKAVRPVVKRRRIQLQGFPIQMLIERTIIDCRFFTLFAVGGSLLGSVLCFMEGCFRILETYFRFLCSLSQKADQGHNVHLIIEAIDMYLVGLAMLIFGVGLYVMFLGSKNITEKGPTLPESNFFGHFNLESVPKWVDMESVSVAKSRIGQAVIMILQVGLLEKFKTIPLLTCLDLACFAGALLLSSASIFLLSKFAVLPREDR